ncbi:MAG: hypothetical protein R3D44_15680 [Hyphomicrobiaceae bacterium]
MPTLDRNGVTIYYECHGTGPAVLLTHGYSATCRMWDGQIAAFKDRFKIIVWDMRGHGESAYHSRSPTWPRSSTPVVSIERSSAACHSAVTCRSPFTSAMPTARAR